MSIRQILPLIAFGAGACLAGYFLAHVLFAERLITLFSAGGTEEFARGIVGDVYFQLLCGAPFPILVGVVVGGLVVLLDHFIKMPSGLSLGIVSIVIFVSGFIGYFPYQLLMLLAPAF